MTVASEPACAPVDAPVTVFVVAGEPSGDQLGAALMEALRSASPQPIRFAGIGGPAMESRGLASLVPMTEIALVGLDEILKRLPSLLRRIRETADAVIAAEPAALVIIDAPEFTHRVARNVRRRAPSLPIVNYVSPTVWAWRPGRARAMRGFVDLVLALLPFEPSAHQRLGGPPCTFVGHPVVARLADVRTRRMARAKGEGALPPNLLVLPGSRRQEVDRLLAPFGETLTLLAERLPGLTATVPAVPHLADQIEQAVADWPVRPTVVRGEAAKAEAFVTADAALAASGTVTLELGVAGVPMAVAYRLDGTFRLVKHLNKIVPIVTAPSMVLPNLILGENAIPEFLDDKATPEALADAMLPLLAGGPARDRQEAALADLDRRMALPDGVSPAMAAADAVLAQIGVSRPSASA